MNTDNLILVRDYFCNPDICNDCYNHVLDSIKRADALIVVEGVQFIDFPKYDYDIGEFLGGLKDKANNSDSPSDAYDYVSVATGFFDTRHEFINHLGVVLSQSGENQPAELKRMFDIAISGYRNLADHVAKAHEFLFRANQIVSDDEDNHDSDEDNRLKG